jgi:hypothetical protein
MRARERDGLFDIVSRATSAVAIIVPSPTPNSGLPEFGRFKIGRSRINPTSAGRGLLDAATRDDG